MTLRTRLLPLIVTVAFYLSSTGVALAQVENNQNEVGANFALNKSTAAGNDTVDIAATVRYGRLLVGGLQLSGDVNAGGVLGGDSPMFMFRFFPALRYYLMPDNPAWTPFIGFGVGVSLTVMKANAVSFGGFSNSKTDVTATYVLVPTAGFNFFVNEDFAVVTSLDFMADEGKFDGGTLFFKIGFSYYF